LRNRYLSFTAGDPGRNQAIQVWFIALPAPWNVWNGTKMWVQAPTDQCEVAAVGIGQSCPAGAPKFKWAKLTCAAPVYAQWSTLGVISVSHPGVIPGGSYSIRVIDETCVPTDEASFSAPLAVTNPIWGDIAGPFRSLSNQYTVTDGSKSITVDVVADLDKFGNRSGSPDKARADVEPCLVDLKINIPDVSRLLDAFRGVAFPFAPGQAAFGCASTNPCNYTAEEVAVTEPEIVPSR
jgi:hypothetical protein